MNSTIFDQLILFNDLTSEQRRLIKPLFLSIACPENTVLFQQGETAEYAYILACGEILIQFKPDDGPNLTIARLRSEGVVGWSSALGNPVYTSTAVCASECQLLKFRGKDLRQLFEQDPGTSEILLARLAAVVVEPLRNTHPQVLAILEEGLQARSRKLALPEHIS